MADQQQSDSTPGTAGSGDGAPQPPRTTPVRPGEAPAPGSARSDPGSGGKPQDRPGSDPKNPGDFGHH
jgi:hypothetical protein